MSPRPSWLDDAPRRDLPTGTKVVTLLDKPELFPIVRCLERWGEGRPLVQEIVPRVFVRTEMRNSLDPDEWHIGFLSTREGDNDPHSTVAMQHKTPQALLRDLHRVEQKFAKRFEPVEGTELQGRVESATHEIYASRRIDPVEVVEPAARTLRARRDEWRRFLDEPWKPSLGDDEARVVERPDVTW